MLSALRRACTLALLPGLAACAIGGVERIPAPEHPSFGGASALARAQREAEMNRQWQYRPLSELVDTLGRPKLVMNIPGGGMVPSFAVVYGTDPRSGCIDAFAVLAVGTPLVRDYYCR